MARSDFLSNNISCSIDMTSDDKVINPELAGMAVGGFLCYKESLDLTCVPVELLIEKKK